MRKLWIVAIISVIAVLSGCSDGNEDANETESTEEQQAEETTAITFRNIDVKVDGLQYKLIGEAQSNEDVFYYTLEHGDAVLEEEEEMKLEDRRWTSFEITGELPGDLVDSEDAPVIVLYAKTEDGERVNPNYVPIDL